MPAAVMTAVPPARSLSCGAVTVTFSRGHNNSVPGFEIVEIATIHLYADPPLDYEEPLRAGVLVPVRSSTVGECHPVHADWNAGRIMGQTLNRRPAEKGCWIDGTDRRVTRSKDMHPAMVLLEVMLGAP